MRASVGHAEAVSIVAEREANTHGLSRKCRQDLNSVTSPHTPWDDKEKVETFTVQPQFEGKAADFGMVIPVFPWHQRHGSLPGKQEERDRLLQI